MANNSQERYNERMYLQDGESEISTQSYNLILGGTLLYGFLVNCFLVYFCADSAIDMIDGNPIIFYIGYFVLAIAGSFMINGSKNPVVSFIGYNCFVLPLGIMLSYLIYYYNAAGFQSTVITAFAITAIVTGVLMVLSSVFPAFFLNLGKALFVTLLVTIVLEVIMMIAGASLGIIDYIVVLIFCGYVGYDWARANICAKTVDNAIDCAASLYLDIVNLFVRLLAILARAKDN